MAVTVAVFGSINMDEVIRVARFPAPGETLRALGVAHHPGGKGANQAVAAVRAGATVRMTGAVGGDAAGTALLAALQDEGIDCRGIRTDLGLPTGKAYVLVDDRGENQILVSAGANASARAGGQSDARVYLTQLECALDQVAAFLGGRPAGATGILNAAPFHAGARSIFGRADIIVVNETELASYCGMPHAPSRPDDVAQFARKLLTHGGQRIVVTLGRDGSVSVDQDSKIANSAESVNVIDSTGAGDCFCGFLAAGIAQGREFGDAIGMAHRAAELAVGRSGAMSSIPRAAELAAARAPKPPTRR